jgi:hypothetical protein
VESVTRTLAFVQFAAAICACLSLACDRTTSPSVPASPGAQSPAAETFTLVGTWSLASVNGAPISTQQLKSHQVHFVEDGTWTFTSEMTGRYEGMHLEGSGTWKFSEATLEYTAGANSGVSTATMDASTLTLDPDPVISPSAGTEKARTSYGRTR